MLKKEYDKIIDFVIPLHRYHYMVRTLLESINKLYSPRNIYIITPECYCEKIEINKKKWNVNDNIIIIQEETFFLKNYNLHYNDIYNCFTKNIDEKNREFGWWYQQLLKLGACLQIENLSDPYIVWDSDLIPIVKWDIYPTIKENNFKFAILQEKAKNNWVTEQYKESLYSLTKLKICDPKIGTFVSHHFIFYHDILKELFQCIENHNKKNWIKSIIDLSNYFFRFSEYRLVSSFMNNNYKNLLKYHSFETFGKFGKRIRESNVFLLEMEKFFNEKKIDLSNDVSYFNFIKFVEYKYNNNLITYLQIEHI